MLREVLDIKDETIKDTQKKLVDNKRIIKKI